MFDLKEFRSENNLTQIELANLFGCKQSFISDIERGKRPMPKQYIDILFDKFGNSKIELHFKDDSPAYKQNISKNTFNEDAENYDSIQKLKSEIKDLKEKLDSRQEVIDQLTQELIECKNKYISLLEKKA